jgi:hypothetical protein
MVEPIYGHKIALWSPDLACLPTNLGEALLTLVTVDPVRHVDGFPRFLSPPIYILLLLYGSAVSFLFLLSASTHSFQAARYMFNPFPYHPSLTVLCCHYIWACTAYNTLFTLRLLAQPGQQGKART